MNIDEEDYIWGISYDECGLDSKF